METDNRNNSELEIRHKERLLRSSKSRSMTPVIKTVTNSEDIATVKNDISSGKHSTARKVITSSSKSVSKSKTISGKTNLTVIVETNSSQEKSTLPKDIAIDKESAARLTSKNENMELRSERQLPLRQSNRSVANGTGKEEYTSSSTRTSNKSSGNRSRTTHMRTSDYSSDDDDLHEEGMVRDAQSQKVLEAYQGEYWNKYPKTDYTYSPVSKDHYREVVPGVSVKPNMSRCTYRQFDASSPLSDTELRTRASTYVSPTTLRTSSSRVTSASTSTTTTRRSRFFDASQAGTRVPAYIHDYASPDSDVDEVDTRVRAEMAAVESTSAFWYFTAFFTTIWSVITTTCTTTVETTRSWLGLQNADARAGYSTPMRRTSVTRSRWGKMLDLLYLLPAYLTCADLRVVSSVSEGGRSKRLGLFAALMFLLLLLLCGWWLLYTLGLEEIATSATTLLADTWTMTQGWFATLGEWGWILWGWMCIPFAALLAQREASPLLAEEYESYRVPPLTVATTPASMQPLALELDAIIASLLASDELEAMIAARLGRFARDDLVREILSSKEFNSWVLLKVAERGVVDIDALTLQVMSSSHFRTTVASQPKDVDVASLVADIWASGQLQRFMDAHLEESKRAWLAEQELEIKRREATNVEALRASWQQTLDDKSKYFDGQNAELHGKFEQLKHEFEAKLNASMSAMKGQFATSEELKRTQEENLFLKARVETCCDKTTLGLSQDDVEKHVLGYIAGMYGLANADKASYAEIQALMGNMFVGKQQFEAALANVSASHRAEMREVSDQSSRTIMDTISERISDEFASHQRLSFAATAGDSAAFVGGSGGLTDGQVMEIVNRAIMTYDADKTGMVDYALESSGGSVINTRCTESYYKHSASMTLFGIPYWYPVNTPRTVIQPGVHPGECWAFRGSQGFLVIQLAGQVRISSFSLEHIPRSLAFNGNIDSAPRDFSVWGLAKENDMEPTELGRYTYLKNSTSLQYFLVKRTDIQPFKIIELRIDSNHGNLEYTCLYRFRVHGTWVSH